MIKKYITFRNFIILTSMIILYAYRVYVTTFALNNLVLAHYNTTISLWRVMLLFILFSPTRSYNQDKSISIQEKIFTEFGTIILIHIIVISVYWSL